MIKKEDEWRRKNKRTNVQKKGDKMRCWKRKRKHLSKKRMQKERMKTQFFRKEERPFLFNEKFLACEMDREKHFLVFSWRRRWEEKITPRFFWAHNEKQRGDSKNKVSKTLKKEPFFEKASHKGNLQTNNFRQENKEERFPFFFKSCRQRKNTKTKEKRKTKKRGKTR